MADVMPGTTSNGTPAVEQAPGLLAAPGEDERIAALEAHDLAGPAGRARRAARRCPPAASWPDPGPCRR